MRKFNLFFLLISILVAFSCNHNNKTSYDISNYFNKSEQDTLMANIVTYIYKVPKGVRKEERFYQVYRPLYVKQIDQFKWMYYHIDENDEHFFYVIRPARNVKGYKRGVAGSFRLNDNFELTEFREIMNTPMQPEEEIMKKSLYLWQDLMYYKSVDRYILNRDFIEFPNESCQYDFLKKEWRYDVVQSTSSEEPITEMP
ncbi:MAG: hypothetical protein JJU28_03545 [Cyclobacteriaceae bacterium]|nr:hypothetical protein [Cyclobacteriaceae bacterium]